MKLGENLAIIWCALLDVICQELIFPQNYAILPCLQHYSIDGKTALECKFLYLSSWSLSTQ